MADKIEGKPNNNSTDFSNDNYSGLRLFNFNYEELPKLIDPIFPKVGLASLVGSSDIGKSTLLRQLAISIALGLDGFLGYKLNPATKNVIFISTEDDPVSTSISIRKPVNKILRDTDINMDKSALNHLKFLFDVDLDSNSDKYIIKLLDKDLSEVGADLVIIDAFTDIFSGDINSSTKVREFLNKFNKIAKKYECLVLFLHHTGKRTDKFLASKNHVLGSQAFEAKMRVLLELKPFPYDETKRTLTITKGNYISSQIKKFSKVLRFDEQNLIFIDTGKKILSSSLSTIAKFHPKKNEIMPIIKELHSKKMSVRKIESELKNRGHNIGKSTVSNYIRELKQNNEV